MGCGIFRIFQKGLLPRFQNIPGSHVVLDMPTEKLSLLRVEGELELDLMAQDDPRKSAASAVPSEPLDAMY